MTRGRPSIGGRVRGLRDEAREADELRVELLLQRPRGALHGGGGVERARDVGAVGVVLRLGDLAARRQQDDEGHAHAERVVAAAAAIVQRRRGLWWWRTANAVSRPSASPASTTTAISARR